MFLEDRITLFKIIIHLGVQYESSADEDTHPMFVQQIVFVNDSIDVVPDSSDNYQSVLD